PWSSKAKAKPVWIQSIGVRRTRKIIESPRPDQFGLFFFISASLTNSDRSLAWAASESQEKEPLIGGGWPIRAYAWRRTKVTKPAHHFQSRPSFPFMYARTQGPQFSPPTSMGCSFKWCRATARTARAPDAPGGSGTGPTALASGSTSRVHVALSTLPVGFSLRDSWKATTA